MSDQPEFTAPEVTVPEAVVSESTPYKPKPFEVISPKAPASEATKPEVTDQEWTAPEAAAPEATASYAIASEATVVETPTPEATAPELMSPEVSVLEAAVHEAIAREATVSEAIVPEKMVPEATISEVAAPAEKAPGAPARDNKIISRPFRVKLRGAVLVLVRLPNRRDVSAAFHQLSTSGGVIHFEKPLDEKIEVELIFHIGEKTIRGKAQMLFPMWATQGWMQPFRFVNMTDANRESLDANLKSFLGDAAKGAAAGK